MSENRDPRELLRKRSDLLQRAQGITDKAIKDGRGLTDDERRDVETLQQEADSLEMTVALATKVDEQRGRKIFDAVQNAQMPGTEGDRRFFDVMLRSGGKAVATMDIRASNDTDMNITTPADGGYAVPTGHYPRIIQRRDEQMIARRLGVMQIPGRGTTVNVTVDNEDDGEFVATGETSAYDRDAPAMNQVAMTLVKYTKKIEMSVEAEYDWEDLPDVMNYIEGFVARGMAKTHNSLLLTEVAANGTSLKTFGSNAAIAAGELEGIVGNDTLGNYLTDGPSAAWVMRHSTYWAINAITAESRFYYRAPEGGLLGYPVAKTNKAATIGAAAKSVYFGDWSFVGVREAPSFTVIRDPFTLAHLGQVRLVYMFRTVYKVLQAGAIGYAKHP